MLFVRSHSDKISFDWIVLVSACVPCQVACAECLCDALLTPRAWLAEEAQHASEGDGDSSEQMKQSSDGLVAGGDADVVDEPQPQADEDLCFFSSKCPDLLVGRPVVEKPLHHHIPCDTRT